MSGEILRTAARKIRVACPIPVRSRLHDFIDYPTGFAMQNAELAHDEKCSAAQTNGAILCDCEAIYRRWREWRTLLAVADLFDRAADDHDKTPCPAFGGLLVAARAYLGSDA